MTAPPLSTAHLVDLFGSLTVHDLFAARTPADLLRQVGVEVAFWSPHPIWDGCSFAGVHLPGVGWFGVYFGMIYGPDDGVLTEVWNSDPPRRLELLLTSFQELRISEPVANVADLPAALARGGVPDNPAIQVINYWGVGFALRACLATLPDEQREAELLALNLGYPRMMHALNGLEAYLDNTARLTAEQVTADNATVAALGEAVLRRWPGLFDRNPAMAGNANRLTVDATALMFAPHDQWPEHADRLLADLLRQGDEGLRKCLYIRHTQHNRGVATVFGAFDIERDLARWTRPDSSVQTGRSLTSVGS